MAGEFAVVDFAVVESIVVEFNHSKTPVIKTRLAATAIGAQRCQSNAAPDRSDSDCDRIATVESDGLGVLADSLASVWVSIARNSGLAAGKSY